jgi:regulator of protease activity HflC (stomatin/prohibitin superfamily)
LDRAFRSAAIRITAGRNLNDFLVVQEGAAPGTTAQATVALRAEVRNALLEAVNARLHELAKNGASLGVEIERIDMTAWLPPQAKSAFDAVLVATQAADRGIAVARTDAERRRQEANRMRDELLSGAQATAQELLSSANVNTAGILALEREATPETRNSLLLREYRDQVGQIMNRVGSATLVDPQGSTRFVLPARKTK